MGMCILPLREGHKRGVGLMLNREAAKAMIEWNPVSDTII